MKKKKLTAILENCKLVDRLFNLREKQIKTALAAAKNDVEEQATEAEIAYENLCKQLGKKDVDSYKNIINKMIECRETIRQAAETKAVLKEIEDDLNSEVDIED